MQTPVAPILIRSPHRGIPGKAALRRRAPPLRAQVFHPHSLDSLMYQMQYSYETTLSYTLQPAVLLA